MLRSAKKNRHDFEDYAHWILKQAGNCLHSPKLSTIVEETDLEKAEFSDLDKNREPEIEEPPQQVEPKITLVKNSGVVTHIEVTCQCGENIRIDLDYQQE